MVRGHAYGSHPEDWKAGGHNCSAIRGIVTPLLTNPLRPRATASALSRRPAPSGSNLRFIHSIATSFAAIRGLRCRQSDRRVPDRRQLVRRLVRLARQLRHRRRHGVEPGGGLIVLPENTTNTHSEFIIGLAARHRVPAIYAYRYQANAGGLISYGVDIADLFRDAASYADRILRGEKPADLPVQAPTKFTLVVNLKTAAALGLTVPTPTLLRATDVIE
jgi:hypothetical protein